jgi:hypothetical protein
MSTILKQRFFFVTKIFEITDRSLKVKISKPMNFVEDEFNFEELTSKMIRKKSPNLLFLLPGLFCILGFAITLYSHFYEKDGSSLLDIGFYVLMGIILLSLSVFTFNNAINLILFDKRYIAFYAKSPDKKSVDDFLKKILY